MFLVQSYYRSSVKVGGEWIYSVQARVKEFQNEFPNVAIDHMQFNKTLGRTLKLFSEKASFIRKSGRGAAKKRTEISPYAEEIMENTPKSSFVSCTNNLIHLLFQNKYSISCAF